MKKAALRFVQQNFLTRNKFNGFSILVAQQGSEHASDVRLNFSFTKLDVPFHKIEKTRMAVV